MTDDALTASLLKCLRPHLAFLGPNETLAMTSRLEDLGLDSAGAIGLMLDLEESFSVSFPDDMLVPATFETPESILAALRTLTGAR